MKKNYTHYFFVSMLLAIASFFSFYHLGSVSLESWDEGIYAQTVLEMNHVPRLLATNNLQPWLEKPVLGFWLHLVGTDIFGINNFGLRFMSALSFVGAVFLFYIITKKFYSFWIAFFTALAFVICPLFYFPHMIRTADFDTYFLFFTLLTFWTYIVSWKNPKLFWAIGLISGISFMVRGYIALLVPLAIGVHILWTRIYRIIGTKLLFLSLLLFLCITVPWHIYAFAMYPAEFMNSYVGYHFFQRIIRPLEGHMGSQWFYFNFIFFKLQFFSIFFLSALTYFLGKLMKYGRDEDKLWLFWFLVFMIPLQVMKTKIVWYMMSIIPVFFFIIASVAYDIYHRLKYNSIVVVSVSLLAVGYILFSLQMAFTYVMYASPQPIDLLTDYIERRGHVPQRIVTYSNKDTFGGPAATFQWESINTYVISSSQNENDLDFYVHDFQEDVIFFTDMVGYKKIKLLDSEDVWRGEALSYFHSSWGETGVPIILERK